MNSLTLILDDKNQLNVNNLEELGLDLNIINELNTLNEQDAINLLTSQKKMNKVKKR